jgi:hypothetical protein
MNADTEHLNSPALLLIACSRRKSTHRRHGAAWELYDGRLYQVLKKAVRGRKGWQKQVHVLIVSARYGILRPETVINRYDERMTPALIQDRGHFWADGLRRATSGRRYRAVHGNLGRAYLHVLPNLEELFAGTPIERAKGGIGVRNAQTWCWLLAQLAPEED